MRTSHRSQGAASIVDKLSNFLRSPRKHPARGRRPPLNVCKRKVVNRLVKWTHKLGLIWIRGMQRSCSVNYLSIYRHNSLPKGQKTAPFREAYLVRFDCDLKWALGKPKITLGIRGIPVAADLARNKNGMRGAG